MKALARMKAFSVRLSGTPAGPRLFYALLEKKFLEKTCLTG
jgi:hypothetical protein